MSIRTKIPSVVSIPNADCNIVICGDANVGSSTFIERIIYDTSKGVFANSANTVIGQIYYEHNGLKLSANVTAFPAGFDKSIFPKFCEVIGSPNLILIIFALDSQLSLDNVKKHIKSMCSILKDIPVIIIGNKSDLEAPVVTDEKIADARADWPVGTAYLPVSALTGNSVRASIGAAIALIKSDNDMVVVNNK
jgi:GTPase SAR1 family protein